MSRLGNIDYTERGAGLPVVLLHGGRLDRLHMIDALEPVFEKHPGYRRIYPDMPGHGASPKDGVETYDDVLDRLSAFVAAVAPDGPILLGGESRGGYFARALAHRFPNRLAGLLLIVPAREPYPPAESLPAPEVRIPARHLRETLPEAIRERFDNLPVQSAEIASKIHDLKFAAMARTDHDWQNQLEANHFFSDDPDQPGKIVTAPTLVLLGRQDTIVGWRDIIGRADAYPHGTVAVLDCAGHSLAWERPQLFEAHVKDWLDRVEHAP